MERCLGGVVLGLLLGLMMSRTEIGQLLTDLIFALIDTITELLHGSSGEGQRSSYYCGGQIP